MSKATLKVSIEGNHILSMDILMLLDLLAYRGGGVPGDLEFIATGNCEFLLEVETVNNTDEMIETFELDAPVYSEDE